MSHFNPFDLLGDEGDTRRKTAPKPAAPKPTTPKAPVATVKKPAAPSTKAAPQQQAQANAKAPANAAPAKKENGAQGDAQKGKNDGAKGSPRPQGDRPRGPRPQGDRPPRPQGDRAQGERKPREDRPPRQPRVQGDQAPSDQPPVDGAPDKAPRRPRERRDRGPAPARGRQFDRRSGTGRAPTENKKGGAGKGNWGADVDGSIEAGKEKPEGEKEETIQAADPAVAEAEKEPEVKSYDEYLAELKTKAVKIEAPKPRAAGEGVDQSAWAGYVPLAKEDLGVDDAVGKKKSVRKEEESAPTVEVNFHFAQPERSGRGGRGGPRGGKGGKGFGRNDNRQYKGNKAGSDASLDLSAQAFPSLSPSAAKPAEQTPAAPAVVKA